MAGTYELLRLAERIEALSAELYGLLAERFRGEPEASALFLRLEYEEAQHASRIRLLAARYRHDARLLAQVAMDGTALEELVRRAEALVVEVRAGGWGDDLAEVKRRLAEAELMLCHAHAHFLSEGGHPELRAFFAQLSEQDEAHAELLGRERRRPPPLPPPPAPGSARGGADAPEGQRWPGRRRGRTD